MRRQHSLLSKALSLRKFSSQYAKGKLTAIDRINLLLDSESFVEVDAHVTHQCHDFGLETQKIAGDAVVAGYGQINGQDVAVYSQDFRVFGGTVSLSNARKICRLYKAAIGQRIPIVGIHDSGGARIQEGVDALVGYAEIFKKNVEASGKIPQIAVVAGPCAGGAVYSPALMDFVFMARQTAHMFLTGPEVVQKVTGESVTAETLGGSRVHSQLSGVAHCVADNEIELFERVRCFMAYAAYKPQTATRSHWEYRSQKAEALERLVPAAEDAPYDMRLLVEALADDGSFFEIMHAFAPNILVGFCSVAGQICGVVASQPAVSAGALDLRASQKGSRFVGYCGAFGIPLLTLLDVPGFLPSVVQEHAGIISHGAEFLRAYATCRAPKVSIVVRKAYGGAFCVMGAKALLDDDGFSSCYSWPSAQIAVMGGEGAVQILHRKQNLSAEAFQAAVSAYKSTFGSPQQSASKGYIDAIISPCQTREVIARDFARMRRSLCNR